MDDNVDENQGDMPFRKSTPISKEETLLILRSYRQHPSNWREIVEEIKENVNLLSNEQQQLYRTASDKKLKDRCCHKFGKLLRSNPENIADQDVRGEIINIRRMERRLITANENAPPQQQIVAHAQQQNIGQVQRPAPAHQPNVGQAQHPAPAQQRNAGQAHHEPAHGQNAGQVEPPVPAQGQNAGQVQRPADLREAMVNQLSDSDQDVVQPVRAPGPIRNRRDRRRSLAELVRSNQELYRRFMTKKVPKILAALQVSSDSSDDNYLQ